MQDHVHNVIARMSLTAPDGKWRALDTMALRAQLGAMRGIVATHLDAALTREFGVQMVAREDGAGNEIEGISRELIERYSTRTQAVRDETAKLAQAWTRSHGREPSKRELQYIQQEATMRSRESKEEGQIDWDALLEKWEAKWDARDGSSLAQVAPRRLQSARSRAVTPKQAGSVNRSRAVPRLRLTRKPARCSRPSRGYRTRIQRGPARI